LSIYLDVSFFIALFWGEKVLKLFFILISSQLNLKQENVSKNFLQMTNN